PIIVRPPASTRFPYTTLFRSIGVVVGEGAPHIIALAAARLDKFLELGHNALIAAVAGQVFAEAVVNLLAAVQRKHNVVAFPDGRDRKSTRLNSSHVSISYAVF